MDNQCRECGKTGEDAQLSKCRVCHRYYCDEHAVVRGGASFCSAGCGTSFFHPDPEDEEEDKE